MRVLITVALITLALAPPATSSTCQEDQPCWNWRTMGNHKRGIVTLAGRRLSVGPARFDAINAGFRIDWQRTPRLKGDGARQDAQDY